jgi:hypothetical protein
VQRVFNLEFALVAGIINNALASVATSKASAIRLQATESESNHKLSNRSRLV